MTRPIERWQLGAFALLGVSSVASVLAAQQTGQGYLALAPFGLLIIALGLINFKFLYYLLLFTVPLSMEYSFGPSLGTDLPDEPLMIGLTLVTIIYLARNPRALPTGFFGHIMVAALYLHLFWVLIAALTSVEFIVSFKVLLTKVWYITTFTVLTAIVVKTEKDLRRVFWCIFIPLTLLIAQVLVRYGLLKFAFDEVNTPMYPFFRNHVNYAAILSVFLPFIWLARSWYRPGTFTRRMLTASILFYLAAIYFSYTRTCYLAVLGLIPVYFIIRLRLMRYAMLLALVGGLLVVNYLVRHNTYLKYAPDFTETIYHDAFNDHLSSTFEGKDVSSMERVYRWVAAMHMFKDKPISGFGPGNFYPYYKHYTVSSFQTYVSDNPERSTTHNYLLLLATEQGAVGLGIFLLLTAIVFIYGESLYHRLKNEADKKTVLTLLLIMAMIYVNLMLSDLLESDKVGPFFFMCIALLASYDIRCRALLKAEA